MGLFAYRFIMGNTTAKALRYGPCVTRDHAVLLATHTRTIPAFISFISNKYNETVSSWHWNYQNLDYNQRLYSFKWRIVCFYFFLWRP